MMIDEKTFIRIKNTQTYPSILWLYAMFLLDIGLFEKASGYSSLSIQKFEELSQTDDKYFNTIVIYCLAEIELFKKTNNKQHLSNALSYQARIPARRKHTLINEYLERLEKEIAKYKRNA